MLFLVSARGIWVQSGSVLKDLPQSEQWHFGFATVRPIQVRTETEKMISSERQYAAVGGTLATNESNIIVPSSATSFLSPPSSSLAVKHGPCLLTLGKKDPGFRNQVSEETPLHLLLGVQDPRLSAEYNQFPCGSTGTSSGNRQDTETCIVRACHTPRQPLQNHPSGNLGEWVTPWSAEGMLDGQHQRVDIPAHAQKGLEEDLC